MHDKGMIRSRVTIFRLDLLVKLFDCALSEDEDSI